MTNGIGVIVLGLVLFFSSVYADIERVSVSSSGEQGNDISNAYSVSSDGRFITFVSTADNLVDNDTNGYSDVFVYDRITGVTERVNVTSTGMQSSGLSIVSSSSADGHFTVCIDQCQWSNCGLRFPMRIILVENDTNIRTDVFVHDRTTGVTERGQRVLQWHARHSGLILSCDKW